MGLNLPVCVKIAVLIPIICPFESSKGPPLYAINQNNIVSDMVCNTFLVEEIIVPEI
jgi:hypothetical protein